MTLGSGKGLFVLRTSTYQPVIADKDYDDDSYGIAFDREGRLVTSSWDGYVRLYDREYQLVAKRKMPDGMKPYAVAFSPDGLRIAVGNTVSAQIEVLSGVDLAPLYSPDIKGINEGAMFSIAWSADGTRLYAAGSYSPAGKYAVRRWDDNGKGAATDLLLAESNIMHLQPLPDGNIAFAAAGPEFGVMADNGTLLMRQSPAIADFRDGQPDFRLSPDGATIQFGYGRAGLAPARFSLADRFLVTDPGRPSPGLTLPLIGAPGLQVSDWLNSAAPMLNGQALRLDKYETSRSLSIMPNGEGFVLGTDWYLRCFDRQGKERWKISAPGSAWGVNVATGGKVIVAAFSDGTIRWYRLADGKEILAFFPHSDRKRWVLWTPSGYYDAAPGADELLGWHVNNGKDRAADFFPVSRFRGDYYRPDVIAKLLVILDETKALRLANEESGRGKALQPINAVLPPVATILSPVDGIVAESAEMTVRFTIRSPANEPVTGVKVLVDGRPALVLTADKVTAGSEVPQEVKILLPERDCTISVIAENRHAAGEPAIVRIARQGDEQREEFTFQPKLYILAIGVGAYKDKELSLEFAAKDAKDFAAVMERQKGGLYRDVSVRVLTDADANRDAILDGLEWLQRQTTSKDVAVVFMSGHGVTDPNGIYYYLPVNAETEKLKSTAVIFTEIRNTLMSLAGKTVLFIDTCHSGNVMGKRRGIADINAVVNELTSAENGVVVFASSTGRQYSLEEPSWGNGAFTKALVEGITGKADYSGKGKITINMLDLYLSERVKELTEGKQTPTTSKPETIQDFPLAVRR